MWIKIHCDKFIIIKVILFSTFFLSVFNLVADTTKKNKKFIIPQIISATAVTNINKVKDTNTLSRNLISKAWESIDSGDISNAYNYIQQVQSITGKDSSLVIKTNLLLIRVLLYIQNYREAITLINNCDEQIHNLNNDSLKALHYCNIGLYYINSNSNTSRNFLIKALKLNKELNLQFEIVRCLNYLTCSSINLDSNIIMLYQASKICHKLGNQNWSANTYNNLANQYIRKRDFTKSLFCLDSAEVYAKKCLTKQALYENYKIRAEVLRLMKHYSKAYYYLSEALNVNDMYIQYDNIRNIETMINQRIIAKKNYEDNLYKKEREIKELNRTIYFILILLILLFLVIIIIIINIKNKRRLNNLYVQNEFNKREVEHKKSEIVNMATWISARYTILDELNSQVSKLTKLKDCEREVEIRKLHLSIKNLLYKNDGADQIEETINIVNSDFIANIEKIHPELTKNDKKLASLLRANLSTKQISIIMNTNPTSVNIARYRMRQHLKLSSEIGLVDYLKSI